MELFLVMGASIVVIGTSWAIGRYFNRKAEEEWRRCQAKQEPQRDSLAKKSATFAYDSYFHGIIEITAVGPLAKAYAASLASDEEKELLPEIFGKVDQELISYYTMEASSDNPPKTKD